METIRFDDFIRLNRGFDLPDYKIEKGEYPVITSTNIKAFHKEYKVEGPMVVTGRSGSLGKVQYIEGRCWPLNTSLYVKDYKGNFPRYVYYFLQMMHLEQYNAGAGVPTLNQNHLHSLKIKIHEKKLQQKIASILSAYDCLIENNTRRMRLLEQMAENLYKEWFVRFRFPEHEKVEMVNGLPKGWERKELSDIADITYGYAFKSNKFCSDNSLNAVVRIRDIQNNSTETYTDESCDERYLIVRNALLIGMDGIFHMCLWNGERAYLNQRVVMLNSKYNDMCNYLLYFAIRPQIKYWEQVIVGTTVAHLGDKHLKKIKVLIPDTNTLRLANKVIESAMKEINDLQQQNQLLTRQRDLLLPRLMSGKLEVKS